MTQTFLLRKFFYFKYRNVTLLLYHERQTYIHFFIIKFIRTKSLTLFISTDTYAGKIGCVAKGVAAPDSFHFQIIYIEKNVSLCLLCGVQHSLIMADSETLRTIILIIYFSYFLDVLRNFRNAIAMLHLVLT